MTKTWIQVVGVFNRANHSGEFVAVQPAREGDVPDERHKRVLVMAVESASGQLLDEVPVESEFGSCGDIVDEGTFQVFMELPEGAAVLGLIYDGQEISVYQASSAAAPPAVESFGLGPRRGHSVPLTQVSPANPNATYTVQAREKGSSIWQTLDVGLGRPDTGEFDLNQFPDAATIEVRVLKSSSFESEEVDRTEIHFGE